MSDYDYKKVHVHADGIHLLEYGTGNSPNKGNDMKLFFCEKFKGTLPTKGKVYNVDAVDEDGAPWHWQLTCTAASETSTFQKK